VLKSPHSEKKVCDFISIGACFICHPRAAEALAEAQAKAKARKLSFIWSLNIEVCDFSFQSISIF
jgi:hypothetical protein